MTPREAARNWRHQQINMTPNEDHLADEAFFAGAAWQRDRDVEIAKTTPLMVNDSPSKVKWLIADRIQASAVAVENSREKKI